MDHPHHGGIWCAADHVAGLHDGPDGTERYDYCFYVNEVFQGRAPGSIAMTSIELRDASPVQATICQQMQWLSPREWGARDCRVVMHETRTTKVRREDQAHVFDMTSELRAGDNPVEIGPTRHAWFNARVSDALALSSECLPVDDRGRNGAAAIGKVGHWLGRFLRRCRQRHDRRTGDSAATGHRAGLVCGRLGGGQRRTVPA